MKIADLLDEIQDTFRYDPITGKLERLVSYRGNPAYWKDIDDTRYKVWIGNTTITRFSLIHILMTGQPLTHGRRPKLIDPKLGYVWHNIQFTVDTMVEEHIYLFYHVSINRKNKTFTKTCQTLEEAREFVRKTMKKLNGQSK